MTAQLALAFVTRVFGEKAGQAAKALLPAAGTVVAVGAQWAATGTFDKVEMVTAVTGLGASALTYWIPNLKQDADVLDFVPSNELDGPDVAPPLGERDEPFDVPDAPVVQDAPPPGPATSQAQAPDAAGPPEIAPEAIEGGTSPPSTTTAATSLPPQQ